MDIELILKHKIDVTSFFFLFFSFQFKFIVTVGGFNAICIHLISVFDIRSMLRIKRIPYRIY